MEIANGVEMLEIEANIMGKPSIINPTLIYDNDMVILVDAGFPGQLDQIRNAIEEVGVSFNRLNMVILTHQDIDHIGSLSSILKTSSNDVQVIAHVEEKPYIQGDKTPIKLAKLEENMNSLTEEMISVYKKLKIGFQNCRVNVDKTLMDGEKLPFCGGITVIYTPGHTPGHICLYHNQSKTLIAGDALGVEDGLLVKTPSSINFDNDLSIRSLKKLTEYDIKTVICYHGGIYKNNPNIRIKELSMEE